jgi:hypothetical protein
MGSREPVMGMHMHLYSDQDVVRNGTVHSKECVWALTGWITTGIGQDIRANESGQMQYPFQCAFNIALTRMHLHIRLLGRDTLIYPQIDLFFFCYFVIIISNHMLFGVSSYKIHKIKLALIFCSHDGNNETWNLILRKISYFVPVWILHGIVCCVMNQTFYLLGAQMFKQY